MIQKVKDLTLKVDQQFFWYNGSQGNDVSRQTSGAYIFRPNRSEPFPLTNGNKATIEIVKGALVQEVRQSFGPIVSQVIRLYRDESYAEFEYTVGPIPVSDHLGKEIITRFDTDIQNGGKFYTDANGREMKERIRNHRDTWKLEVSEPVSGNYYPINSRIFINDTKSQLTVMTDRSQGGSSIRDGQLEIMLHRRLLKDDFLGVGEPLNEPGLDGKGLVTRGKNRVLFTTPEEGYHLHREQGELMMLQPILSFSKNPRPSIEVVNNSMTSEYSALSRPLPSQVRLLTMETVRQNELLLRLENFFEDYEGGKVVTVNLDGLFKEFSVVSLTELNLSANQELKNKKMWHWNTTKSHHQGNPDHRSNKEIHNGDSLEITLRPMEIRTFMCKIQKN